MTINQKRVNRTTLAKVRRRQSAYQVVSPDGIILWSFDTRKKANRVCASRNKRLMNYGC